MACHKVGAIAWTNDDILLIGTLEINLCEIILQSK